MIRVLPVYKGYKVDMRLQEFRKIEMDKLPEFIPFLSDKGAKLFHEFRQTDEGRKELTRLLGRNEQEYQKEEAIRHRLLFFPSGLRMPLL